MKSGKYILGRSIVLMMVATSAGLISSSVDAKKFQAPPMPVGYDDPGQLPDNLLQTLIGALRTKLNDPYSMRDFSLCQSRQMPAVEALSPTLPWRRAYWIVHFKVNAKNAYGGYTGLQAGLAAFKDGKFDRISMIGSPIEEGPPKEAREPCQIVPEDQIQQMLR